MTDPADLDEEGSPTVVLYVWQVSRRDVPRALVLMARQRRAVRKLPFGKLLGTGSGHTFASRDVNLRQYALLTCWPHPVAAASFDHGTIVAAWSNIASAQRRIELRPLVSRGTWSGRTPFGQPERSPRTPGGPVAALTHARIRTRKLAAFQRAVPDVAADLATHHAATYLLAFGEAPIGIQGTFSIWESETGMDTFARGPAHRDVITRRATEDWYAEEIFARFVVVSDESIP